jgi:hypothetical protein
LLLEFHEEVARRLEIAEMRQVFADFLDGPSSDASQKVKAEKQVRQLVRLHNVVPVATYSHEMKLTARPPELIGKVRGLLYEPWQGNPRTKPVERTTARVDTIKLPIKTTPQKPPRLRISHLGS